MVRGAPHLQCGEETLSANADSDSINDGLCCHKICVLSIQMTPLFVFLRTVKRRLITLVSTVGKFTYDAVAYNVFSYQTEKLYFSRAQWIEDTGGDGDQVLSVFSCKKKGCDVDSSKEYRFRDSMYLDVVHWFTKFEPYEPTDVAGVLMAELNYCTATAYGKRFKPLDWYPYIYDIECTVLPQNNVDTSIND